MGRPSLAEQRRVEICRALQSCVIRNGSYEMTSVKDIAQEAGMAAGMLHHYFESKDDILLVTAEMVLLELQNPPERPAAHQGCRGERKDAGGAAGR